MQVWFKNRRAKFRKDQKCSSPSSLEDMPHCSKVGQEDATVEDKQDTTTACIDSNIFPPLPPRPPHVRDVCPPPLTLSDADISRCTLRLHSTPLLPVMRGECHGHAPHQPVLGVLSSDLPLPPLYWPIIQQQHSSTLRAPPSSGSKHCSLSLQTAFSSKTVWTPRRP